MSFYDSMCSAAEEEGDVLSEFLVIRPPAEVTWSREATLRLIARYKVNRPRVGTASLKRMQDLWQALSRELSEASGSYYTSQQCENRWRVLERNYKKVVDNNKSSGRGRKNFEYERELDEIFQRKANVNPPLLLAGHVVSASPERAVPEQPGDCSNPGTSQNSSQEPDCPSPPSKRHRAKKRAPRDDVAEERRAYQKARLELDQERIRGREQREEQNLQIQTEMLQTLREMKDHQREIVNQMAQHNALLKKYIAFRMGLEGLH